MTASSERKEYVQVEDTPDIPELRFRHFRGESDYPHMLAIQNGSKITDGVERTPTLENLANIYAHLDNCDPYKDMLFAEVSAEVIGFSRVWWDLESNGEYGYTLIGLILPSWRRKGIGTSMLRYNEERLREIAADHPSESPKFLQSWATEKEVALIKLMEKENYQPIRYFYEMIRPISTQIPETGMPDGLVVRQVKEEEYRKVFAANDEGFRDHWGHVPLTENRIQRFMDSPRFNPEIWKVAWDGDEVAGMVLNFVDEKENEEFNRKRGYTEEIVVRRPYRKRGLAKSLIALSITMFRDMGMEETAMGVDADNLSGALKLYEYMGYQARKRTIVFRKPMD